MIRETTKELVLKTWKPKTVRAAVLQGNCSSTEPPLPSHTPSPGISESCNTANACLNIDSKYF